MQMTRHKAVVVNSQKGLQQIMDNLKKITREFSMKINAKKHDVTTVNINNTF